MKRKLVWLIALVLLLIVVGVAWMALNRPSTKGRIVKVAVILPQTGPQAAIGRGATNSIKLAFDKAAEKLSAKGIKAELVILDDQSKPETAVTQAQKVTAMPDVALVIAHFNTPCALATVKIFHNAGLPVIVPAAVGSKLTEDGYKEVIRTCNTDVGQAKYMAEYIESILKAKKVFIVDDSSAFGTGFAKAVTLQLGTRQIKIAGTSSFQVGDKDFSPSLERIKVVSPDAVILACMAPEGALFRKQMMAKKMTVPLIGFSGIFYDTYLKAAGDAANGTMAIFPLPPLDRLSGGSDFVDAYKAAGFTDKMESAGPFGYVAGQVAIQLLLEGADKRESIINAMHSSSFDTIFGKLKFSDRGEMELQMYSFYTVKDGNWQLTHSVDASGHIIAK